MEVVEGAEGEGETVEKFKEIYEALYNSSESQEAMRVIKDSLKMEIGPNSIDEVVKITGRIVKEAACRMKPGKSDISGAYSSDALLNAPDSFFESIAAVFRSFLVHGTVSKFLLGCAFLPLLKSTLKDPSSTDSYRAIACSSLILKLFDNCILLLWGDLLSSDSLQFGFKQKASTTQCSWLVMEVTGHYLRSGTTIIATLLVKICNCGVSPIVIRVLIYC